MTGPTAQHCRVVALRKESVDRNGCAARAGCGHVASLSARRAWIEMHTGVSTTFPAWSLSARRAWIEMLIDLVDSPVAKGRSPQGERG